MKKVNMPILLLLLVPLAVLGQNKNMSTALTPISGHYKTLAKLSGLAIPDSTDRKQFPLEGLSPKNPLKLLIRPQYLLIPISNFKLPNFPANSSIQTKAEIEFLLELQNTARTEEKVKESLAYADVYYNTNTKKGDADFDKMQKNMFHMGRQIDGFNPENLPKTAYMMTKVWNDATYYFWALKFQYNRTRPYMLDNRIKNLNNTNFQAYPSGHSSASYVAAYVYQELLTKNKTLILKNAFDMAFSREIIGVHFPSDSEAGRVFARQFVNELFKTESFIKDFSEAKKEIKEKISNP